MTNSAFDQMVLLLRQKWTRRQGAVFRLQRAEDDSSPLLLCAGVLSNQGFCAENCKVWQDTDLVYEGPIESTQLAYLLALRGICFGELTTASKLDVTTGACYCFGDPDTCKAACQMRRPKRVKSKSV